MCVVDGVFSEHDILCLALLLLNRAHRLEVQLVNQSSITLPIQTHFFKTQSTRLNMDDLYDYEKITHEIFSELLGSYKELVPSKLDELEEQRLETIPKALSERADDAHLKKTEVQKLVDWKLYVEKR